MNSKDLWEQTISQRIDEVLREGIDSGEDPEEDLRRFCEVLEAGRKEELMVLLDKLEYWKFEQYQKLYKGAFRDGYKCIKTAEEQTEESEQTEELKTAEETEADSDFLEMMVEERIKSLIFRKLSREEKRILDEGEQVIQSLQKEAQEKLERYMDLSIEQEAEDERSIYQGGLKDGIRLMWRILSLRPEKAKGQAEQ